MGSPSNSRSEPLDQLCYRVVIHEAKVVMVVDPQEASDLRLQPRIRFNRSKRGCLLGTRSHWVNILLQNSIALTDVPGRSINIVGPRPAL